MENSNKLNQNLSTNSKDVRTKCQELHLTDEQLNEVASKISHQIKFGLDKDTHDNADIKCFITYVQDMPTGNETGKYLAVDLSCANVRIVLIDLNEDYEIHSKIYEVPLSLMTGTGDKLFDYIAECLHSFMIEQNVQQEKFPLGFIFSFPLKQFDLSKGILIKWSKGFNCSGVIGKDVVQLLRDAIARRGDIEIDVCAVLNESTCTMMSCAWETQNCKIGVTIGTGTNASYVEKVEKAELFDSGDNTKEHVVINTEWGSFGDNGDLDFIRTQFDKLVDEDSNNPGEAIYEKMISGMYIGELVRHILVQLTEDRVLFDGNGSNLLFTKGEFDSKYLFQIESDEIGDYTNCYSVLNQLNITSATDEDCENIRYVCTCILARSAHLVSCGIAVLIDKIHEPFVTIAIDGSVCRFHSKYIQLMCCKIRKLIEPSMQYSIMAPEHGCGRGAALVAVAALRVNKSNDSFSKIMLKEGAIVEAERDSLDKEADGKALKIAFADENTATDEAGVVEAERASLDKKSDDESLKTTLTDKKTAAVEAVVVEAERDSLGKQSDNKSLKTGPADEITVNESNDKFSHDNESDDKSLRKLSKEKAAMVEMAERVSLDKKSDDKSLKIDSADEKTVDESNDQSRDSESDKFLKEVSKEKPAVVEAAGRASLDKKSDDESLKMAPEDEKTASDEAAVVEAERDSLGKQSDDKSLKTGPADEITVNESNDKFSHDNESDDKSLRKLSKEKAAVAEMAERVSLDKKSDDKSLKIDSADEKTVDESNDKSRDSESGDKFLKEVSTEKPVVIEAAGRASLDKKSDDESLKMAPEDEKTAADEAAVVEAERDSLGKQSDNKSLKTGPADEITVNESNDKFSHDNESDDKSLRKVSKEQTAMVEMAERGSLDKKSDDKSLKIAPADEKTAEDRAAVDSSRNGESDDNKEEAVVRSSAGKKSDEKFLNTAKADEITVNELNDKSSRDNKSDDKKVKEKLVEVALGERSSLDKKPNDKPIENTSLGNAEPENLSEEVDNPTDSKKKKSIEHSKLVFERGSGLFDTDDSNDSDENPGIGADSESDKTSLEKLSEEEAVVDRSSAGKKSDDKFLNTAPADEITVNELDDKSSRDNKSDENKVKKKSVVVALGERSSLDKKLNAKSIENISLGNAEPKNLSEKVDKPTTSQPKVVFERGSGLFDTDDSNDSDENPGIGADK